MTLYKITDISNENVLGSFDIYEEAGPHSFD